MPTGYTADVQSGKVETLQDYAYQCARAFGALIMMRDESSDTPIPKKFEPNTKHHDLRLAVAQGILARTPSPEECEQRSKEDFDKALITFNERTTENEIQHDRYKSMLTKVAGWAAPKDHAEMKVFMIDQLKKSIDFDIHAPEMPIKKSGSDWLKARNDSAEWDVEYHTRNIKEEIERVDGRNIWLSQLRESLLDQTKG